MCSFIARRFNAIGYWNTLNRKSDLNIAGISVSFTIEKRHTNTHTKQILKTLLSIAR